MPFVIELERPCDLPPGEHTLEVIVDGDLCVANLDGRTSLSTRIYDRPSGRLGVFVGEGAVVVNGCPCAPVARRRRSSNRSEPGRSPRHPSRPEHRTTRHTLNTPCTSTYDQWRFPS